MLEAMAHGTVPVLSPTSSHVEVAGDSGAYATAIDPSSLADALHQVLDDSVYAQDPVTVQPSALISSPGAVRQTAPCVPTPRPASWQ